MLGCAPRGAETPLGAEAPFPCGREGEERPPPTNKPLLVRRTVCHEYTDGTVQFFQGEPGYECLVCNEMPAGSTHFFIGEKGVERLVRTQFADGGQEFYLGMKGVERCVRAELVDGTREFYEGERGAERLVQCEFADGATEFFDGQKGAERLTRAEHADGTKEYYQGERGAEQLVRVKPPRSARARKLPRSGTRIRLGKNALHLPTSRDGEIQPPMGTRSQRPVESSSDPLPTLTQTALDGNRDGKTEAPHSTRRAHDRQAMATEAAASGAPPSASASSSSALSASASSLAFSATVAPVQRSPLLGVVHAPPSPALDDRGPVASAAPLHHHSTLDARGPVEADLKSAWWSAPELSDLPEILGTRSQVLAALLIQDQWRLSRSESGSSAASSTVTALASSSPRQKRPSVLVQGAYAAGILATSLAGALAASISQPTGDRI